MEKPFFTRHPKFTSWFREGGFFILISMGITFLKYLMLLKLPAVYNIGTTFLTGGIAMAVFFGINKVIFAPGFGEKKQRG